MVKRNFLTAYIQKSDKPAARIFMNEDHCHGDRYNQRSKEQL